MKLIDVITSPWAIQPEKYQEILHIYHAHVHGEKIDIAAIEAQIGRPLKNQQARYQIIDGVAVIPVHGVIAKRMNMMTDISGGSSTQIIADDLKTVLADPEVKAILLDIDSPGGTIDGTQDLAQLIMASRGEKTIAALADGMMASAAYWIGSAAEQVYMTNDTSIIGSIGVVATHQDWSKQEEKMGVKTTEIYAGKYKRIASQYAPLSDEAKAYIQDQVDYFYTVFVNDVAAQRGVDVDTVLEKMADGKLFIGRQAIDAGLVDGITSMAELIKKLSTAETTEKTTTTPLRGGTIMGAKSETVELKTELTTVITAETIEHDHPDIAKAFIDRGRKEGSETERNRIKEVEDQSIRGHEALIESLKFDGKTTGPEAAAAVLKAEKENRAKVLSDLKTDSPEPAPVSATDPVSGQVASGDIETQAKQAWDRDENLRPEFGQNYDRYLAYRRADALGLVKILKK